MQTKFIDGKLNTRNYKDDAKQALSEGIPKNQYANYRSGVSRISIIRKMIQSGDLSLRDYRDKIIACMPGTGKTTLVKINNAEYRKARMLDFDFGNLWKINDLRNLPYQRLNNVYGKITKVLAMDPNDSIVFVNTPLHEANIFVVPLPDANVRKLYLKRIFEREGHSPFYKLASNHYYDWIRDWTNEAHKRGATIIYIQCKSDTDLTHLAEIFLPCRHGQYKYLQWVDSSNYKGLTYGGFIISL